MSWRGHLRLDYRLEDQRTTALDRHEGPLRVLQRLYPEGDAICHHVLVHPPGGIVGGDQLAIEATLGPGTHALITTPGATRFYRSAGAQATQTLQARLAAGARLEWLPLETIAYSGCRAANALHFELAPGAQMIGWDLLALGLPAAELGFERGELHQTVSIAGRWLEQGRIRADDRVLLDSPLGWAGQRALATLWCAAGDGFSDGLREQLLEDARACIAASPLAARAGVSAADDGVVVLRALAPRTEALFTLARAVRAGWRRRLWSLAECPPRLWAM
ncbi:urease accessory protein UreD [Ideonella sp. 4Y16]|uniref:Urease accessory protein UreD n=1 Tax=Ideonella alba TaxID=2824118 RepID=A0A941BKA1_9BURK|nr:urease accessory protein UreD [Ideonella alba]MBQ0929929.1 urease accessory protein UreD [Ideonella alba]MBQ0942163.1 urease accessory protein UreD [Ideonella alba]